MRREATTKSVQWPPIELSFCAITIKLDRRRFRTPTVAGPHTVEPRLPGIPAVGA